MGDVELTAAEAIERLSVIPDYDPGGEEGPGPCVHSITGPPLMIGAHHRLPAVEADLREAIEIREVKGFANHDVGAKHADGKVRYYEVKS